LFYFTFYIFSLLLSYTDCTKFIVPNIIVATMALMLLYIRWMEDKIYISSFIIPVLILAFFIIILLIIPTTILGGGDIKYMMVVGFFLPSLVFPLFLLVSGILQTLALLYAKKVKKRRVVAMVPLMFVSVLISQGIVAMGWYI